MRIWHMRGGDSWPNKRKRKKSELWRMCSADRRISKKWAGSPARTHTETQPRSLKKTRAENQHQECTGSSAAAPVSIPFVFSAKYIQWNFIQFLNCGNNWSFQEVSSLLNVQENISFQSSQKITDCCCSSLDFHWKKSIMQAQLQYYLLTFCFKPL